MLSMTLWLLTALVPLQIALGDQHGLNTLRYQPEKVAAMEGDWETRAGQPLILFGWPDEAGETNRAAVEIPYLGSLILTHSLSGTVRGLKEWPPSDRPPVAIVFWTFRKLDPNVAQMAATRLAATQIAFITRFGQFPKSNPLRIIEAPPGLLAQDATAPGEPALAASFPQGLLLAL